MKKQSANSQNKLIKECIFSALMQLMEQQNFNDITITRLTRKAGVSRISYYRNYNSKEEIITDYIDETIEQLTQELQETPYDAYEYMCMFFENIERDKQLVMNLVRSNMSHIFLDRYKYYMRIAFEGLLKSKHKPSHLAGKYEVNFLVGGLYEIMTQWFKNGMVESNEEMASIFFELTQ